MAQLIGVAHPIPEKLIHRFFEEGKTVFIKPRTVFQKLIPNMKLFFYQGGNTKRLVGEATIKNITYSYNYEDIFDSYGSSVFMSRDEFIEYVNSIDKKWGSRARNMERKRERIWVAFNLEKIVKYDQPKRVVGMVPVSGKYIYDDYLDAD